MKKILVFSHNCFSQTSNNGKTLSNIFSHFPPEELCQFYLSDNEHPDFTICKDFFQITDSEILNSYFQLRSNVGRTLTNKFNNSKTLNQKTNNFKPKRINDTRTILRNILWRFSKWKSLKFSTWLQEQNPRCIFFVGGNYTFSHRIARIISETYNIPLITYFTDDYILYPIYKGLLSKLYKHTLTKCYKATVYKSDLLFCIGDMMSSEYSKYFRREFNSIMNCVDPSESINIKENNSSNLRISYFGGLHLKRADAILTFSEYLKKNISSNCPLNVEIFVYTFSSIDNKTKKIFQKNNVILQLPVKGDDLKKAISDSNILLHVESNDEIIKSYTKLSVSTKIPEYFISNRPVIGYGPSDVASMRLLSDNNLGLVIDSQSKFQDNNIDLKELLESQKKRAFFAEKAYKYANTHFLKEKVSINLYDTINQIVNYEFIH